MKFIFVHRGPYLIAHGGGTRADRFLMRTLAMQGHDCRCLVSSPGTQTRVADGFLEMAGSKDTVALSIDGVATEIYAETRTSVGLRLMAVKARLKEIVQEESPDWVVVTGTDKASTLLAAALNESTCSVVKIIRSTGELGFGPNAVMRDDGSIQTLKRCTKVVCGSNYMSDYIKRWGGLRSVPLMLRDFKEPGPLPTPVADRPFVTMINPSAIKGIDIFIALAKQLPSVRFAAVPTWATTTADRRRLAEVENIALIPAADDIDLIFAQTRILLVPSLCDEAFGTVIVEALMRGIPVIASRLGGIPEAMLGNPFLVDVSPIKEYRGSHAENGTPDAVVPEQCISEWCGTLQQLMGNPDLFEAVSMQAKTSALEYADKMRRIDPISVLVDTAAGERRRCEQ